MEHQALTKSLSNHERGSSLRTISTLTDEGYARALTYVASDVNPTSHTRLLPVEVCDYLIARHGSLGPPMSRQSAKRLVVSLLARWPGSFVGDLAAKTAYMGALEIAFQAFPEHIGQTVCSPLFRISEKPQFSPSADEVVAALTHAKREFLAVAFRAQWHKDEAARRNEERELEIRTANRNPQREAETLAKATTWVKKVLATPNEPPLRRYGTSYTDDEKQRRKEVQDGLAAMRARRTPEEQAEWDRIQGVFEQRRTAKAEVAA